ncbi:MAG: PQQ-binding-like beta-propeller repeat protein [Myxococcales bacterium]|nr:PQQ-binding-like beta-propeller repeat protein [Myxococcales bacterium]
MKSLRNRALVLGFSCTLLGCATSGGASDGFGSAGDPGQVAAALARSSAVPSTPRNATGRALALLAGESGSQSVLVAVDLEDNRVIWCVPAEVDVRAEVGREVVVYGDPAGALVGLDVRTGREMWRVASPRLGTGPATLLGHAVDGEGVFAVYKGPPGASPPAVILGLSEQGTQRFRRPLDERVGAPAARGGVVAVPQRSQFVTLLDGRTGESLADILARDEAAAFVRGLPEGFMYGSQGVFVASRKTALGTHAGGGYLKAKLPEFVRPVYHYDMYKPAHARHSAIDRNRLLWRVSGSPDAPAFRNGQVVVHNFRFFFGLDAATADLTWAYSHPRLDAIGAVHTGPALVFADAEGNLGALEARSGRLLMSAAPAGLGALKVRGASFDAEGFGKPGPGAQPSVSISEALKAIALDPDKRFHDVQVFAIEQLSRSEAPGVTAALLEVLQRGEGEPYLLEKAADSLVERQDPRSLPLFLEAIEVKPDYAEGRAPQRLELIARALAKLGARDAMPALVDHIRLPQTDPSAVSEIAAAVIALEAKEVIAAFRDYLSQYRADPAFMSQPGALIAAANVLARLGDTQDRTLLLYVAEEPKTLSSLKVAIERLLAESSGGPEVTPRAY